MNLHIPEVTGMSLVDAALSYAAAGWFVLPVDPSTKHAGSLVGTGWNYQSSCDEATIRGWWLQWPTAALALHVGKSGAVALDVDKPDNMPPLLARANAECNPPAQSTRLNDPRRAHYLYAATPGSVGNSTGDLGRDWGDVRGFGGIIVVEPTPHSKVAEGGCYRWVNRNPLPALPDYLRAALRPPGANGKASVAETADFIEALPDLYGPCPVMQRELAPFPVQAQRHEELNRRQMAILRAGDRGHQGAAEALGELFEVYSEALAGERSADDDWQRGLNGAVAIIRAEPTADHEKHCCGSWLESQRWPESVLNRPVVQAYPLAPQYAVIPGVQSAQVVDPDGLSRFLLPDAVWESSDPMRIIYQASMARVVSPDAVLHAVLTIIASMVNYTSRVETGKGSSPLSYFFAPIGPSGAGKSEALKCARQLLGGWMAQRKVSNAIRFVDAPLGSGEGLIEAFMGEITVPVPGAPPNVDGTPKTRKERAQTSHNALFHTDEGRQVLAIGSRSGATVLAVLCELWSGSVAGQTNATSERSRRIEAGSYTVGVLAGFQTATISALFEDEAGGAPQRFAFAPAVYPRHLERLDAGEVEWPGQLQPTDDTGSLVIELGPDQRAEVLTIARRRAAGLVDDESPLDGHRMLLRCRVAALLALLHSTDKVSPELWALAQTVVAASCGLRDHVAALGVSRAREARVGAARADSIARAEGTAAVEANTEIVRAAGMLRAAAERMVERDQRPTRGKVLHGIRSDLRHVRDQALDYAVGVGWVRLDRDETGTELIHPS